MEDAKWLFHNEIKTRLIVVKLNFGPIDALSIVKFLLKFEDMLIEIKLQVFICEIDTELLKRIDFEVFKAKNIQDTNRVDLEKEIR